MVKRATAIIRYDGPALKHHEMDVHQLAPALLAIGDLCKLANQSLNGEVASVKVLVRADVEQKCFQLEFQLVQTLFDSLVHILEQERIQNAKNILEWIGMVAGGTAFVGATVFGVIKFLSQKKPEDAISVSAADRHGNVTYKIEGNDNTIIVNPVVDRLVQDPRVLSAMKHIVAPLTEEGYDSLEFEKQGVESVYFTRAEATKILRLSPEQLKFDREGELISIIRTAVKVRKPVFEGESAWGINYKRAVNAKLMDDEWLSAYQSGQVFLPVGSRLVVDLREIVPVDEDRIETGPARYEIIKVHGVEIPPEQIDLLN